MLSEEEFVRVIFGNSPPLIAFDTDVNAPALSEYLSLKSNHPHVDSTAYITVGTGVGVGLVVNGSPVHGLIHPEGGHLKCSRMEGDDYPGCCEKHGDCIEGLTSAKALSERAGLSNPSELRDLEDDHFTFICAAHTLSCLISSLILTISPHKIVIGGGIVQREGIMDKIWVQFLVLNDWLIELVG